MILYTSKTWVGGEPKLKQVATTVCFGIPTKEKSVYWTIYVVVIGGWNTSFL